MINKSKLILISSAILLFTALSASAQMTRVYVADSGDDANLCTKASQCKTVTKAMMVVNDGGEVIITDSGDYDAFVVTKSVTVAAAPGVNAGIVSTDSSAIIISAPSPLVVNSVSIRNLNIKNISRLSNTAGITNSAGTNLYVDGCTFTGFENGIAEGNKSGKLFVHDSTFRMNTFGVLMNTPVTEGAQIGVIDNCKFEHNEVGVLVATKSFVTIRNSVLSDNASFGIWVLSTKANLRAEATIDNCQITGNTDGLKIGGTTGISIVRLFRSTVTQNALYGVAVSSFGTFYSLQNNVISGNPTDVSGILTPLSVK